MQDDMWEWQKTFTDAEREAHKAWMEEMSIPEDHPGGKEAREAHEKEIDEIWDEVEGGGDGKLNREQFQAYFTRLNDLYVSKGLKGRDYTEEEWDMVWAAFNGYNGGQPEPVYEGVTRDDMNYVTEHATY